MKISEKAEVEVFWDYGTYPHGFFELTTDMRASSYHGYFCEMSTSVLFIVSYASK